jgi:ribonuclease HI
MEPELTFSFGKFKGIPIKDVFEQQPTYLEWVIKQRWFKDKFIKEYKLCLLFLNKTKEETHTPIQEDDIVIYTDGACSKNGSLSAKAGIGVHFSKRNNLRFQDISEPLSDDTLYKPTNQRAELQAILEALRRVKEVDRNIIIYTDSDYSIKCVTQWYPNWLKKNTLAKKKNIDLIQPIAQYYQALTVEFRHIRSHTGLQDEHSLGNEEADRLATSSLVLQ